VSAKYSKKPLYKLLTSIISAVKTGLQSYSGTSYEEWSESDVDSKDMLEYIHTGSLTSYK